MTILTLSEVEELTDHLATRPDLWIPHRGVWVRRIENEQYAMALEMRVLHDNLYALTYKSFAWSPATADTYVEWLLEKYTAYDIRMKVVHILAAAIKSTADINILSRDICELQGGTFLRKREQYHDSVPVRKHG